MRVFRRRRRAKGADESPRRRSGPLSGDPDNSGNPGIPGATAAPLNGDRARLGWLAGGALALLLAGATIGHWLWQSGRSSEPLPTLPPAAGQAAPLVQAPAGPPTAAAPARAKAPVPWTTLAELLQRPASERLRWSRFEPNPAILVLEYPNLREQGLAMNRLAAMFEKRAGHRDRVLTEAELSELMRRSGDTVASFYQGHDYPAAKVARFFTLAESQRMLLNPQETQLLALLVDSGFMKRSAGGAYQAMGEQAAVSFTGVQPDDPATAPDEAIDRLRREAVLRHELSHGEFFTNADYRAHSLKFWRNELREQERRVFSAYLAGLDYNPGDEELMANETQALLMHTPDSRAFSAGSLGVSDAALADLRNRFRRGEPVHGLKR